MLRILKFGFITKLIVVFVILGFYSCTYSTTEDTSDHLDYSVNSDKKMIDSTISEPLLMPYCSNGKWGFIDTTGQLIIPTNYNSAYGFTEGVAAIKVDSLWGYIDKNNRWVIEPEFDSCLPYFENRAAVMRDNQWGFIDKTGEVVIPFQYEKVKAFSEGLAGVLDGDKWRFIDSNNNVVINMSFDKVILGFYNGEAHVFSGKNLLKINKIGEVILPYTDPLVFSEGLARMRGENGKFGYVDTTGEFVIQPQYFVTVEFSEGLAGVGKLHEPVGFIDTTGEIIIPPTYQLVGKFKDGLAPAQDYDNFKWGYIDKRGNWIVAPDFFYAYDFSGDCAPVALEDNQWKLIDRKGDFASEVYEQIEPVKWSSRIVTPNVKLTTMFKQLENSYMPFAVVSDERIINNLFWAKTVNGWILINSDGVPIDKSPQPFRASFN